MVLDLEAAPLEQVERLQPIGAGVARHHHPVEFGYIGGRGTHGCAFLSFVIPPRI
jgi:hypothetical protein